MIRVANLHIKYIEGDKEPWKLTVQGIGDFTIWSRDTYDVIQRLAKNLIKRLHKEGRANAFNVYLNGEILSYADFYGTLPKDLD